MQIRPKPVTRDNRLVFSRRRGTVWPREDCDDVPEFELTSRRGQMVCHKVRIEASLGLCIAVRLFAVLGNRFGRPYCGLESVGIGIRIALLTRVRAEPALLAARKRCSRRREEADASHERQTNQRQCVEGFVRMALFSTGLSLSPTMLAFRRRRDPRSSLLRSVQKVTLVIIPLSHPLR